MKILTIVGTRPNFIKVTRFREVAKKYANMNLKIVHTGQHYDNSLATVFFEQFELVPDYFLNASGGSPNFQIADIMVKLEKLILETFRPDLILAVGDVNSTLAAALTANKMNIRLGHVESGLRSFDNSMPEEYNRIITDRLSDVFFVTEPSGLENLKSEGVSKDKIFYSGNTMIDTLVKFKPQIENSDVLKRYSLFNDKYILATLHRPATVDEKNGLEKMIELFDKLSHSYKIIFPIHPRTVGNLKNFGLQDKLLLNSNIICCEPLGYFDFQNLISNCKFIITDSGGIQEESTFLLKPCLTLRANTERPVTCIEGTNTLVPFDIDEIMKLVKEIEIGEYKKGKIPFKWDGYSTERIFEALETLV